LTSYLRSILRGSLALFGVALGLIGFAGVASAQEANDANIGDGLFIERPAPSPDPSSELRSEPAAAPAPAPTPAPAPAAAPTSGGGTATAAQTTAASAPSATVGPVRATEVRGIQLERPATPASPDDPATLARTGVDSADLTVVAGLLIALGALLIRTTRPRPLAI
jgi:hypothetical protein